MRFKLLVPTFILITMLLSAISAAPVGATSLAAGGTFTRQISSSGTTSFQAGSLNDAAGIQWPEFAGSTDNGPSPAPYSGSIVNRSQSTPGSNGISVNSGQKAKSNPELNLSFDGLNHRQQRLANGGNQFSLEPPDQGLCVGNGFVLETVNDVMRVYSQSGSALVGVTDLNTFYGYPPAINRSTGVRGEFVTDPSCYYDPDTQHWFHVVLTLDSQPNGAFTGNNHLDVAVSQTSAPTGSWTIYRIPVQDNGTDGTPDHGCSFGFCLGDYPHIGADANGFYITTNEYSLFGPEYKSAQIYALSKAALASGTASVGVVQFDTAGLAAGNPGFTIWPAESPSSQYRTSGGGTEFFLSSDAAAEANGSGVSSRIFLWKITNTASLNTSSPALSLGNTAVSVNPYAIPPTSDQKAGDFPLGQCLNAAPCATFLNGGPDPFAPEVLSHLDSNDTRMQQVIYANGKVWGALDTALTIGGVNKAGIEWFILNPGSSSIVSQGYVGLANNNLTYPAIGVTASGRGVMAFTVVGGDYYPSAGYAGLDAVYGAGPIHVAAAGLGPDDGFTSYKLYVGNPPRTRWGDYGAAVADGNSIWIASEYIGQTCTLAQYSSAPFGSCGGTRSTLANWGTRISKVTP